MPVTHEVVGSSPIRVAICDKVLASSTEVVQMTVNHWVAGSIPASPAKLMSDLFNVRRTLIWESIKRSKNIAAITWIVCSGVIATDMRWNSLGHAAWGHD